MESPQDKADRIAEIRKEFRIYSFDKALRTTINKDYKKRPERYSWCTLLSLKIWRGAPFQVHYLFFNCIQASLGSFIMMAQALLEKEPPRVECYDDDTDTWSECDKSYICINHVPRDHYRFDENEDEFIDNWVE